MSEPIVQVSRTIDASPAEVWDALTRPDKLKSVFFGADVEGEFRVGGRLKFTGEFNGKSYEDKGEIRTFAPQKRLAMSHFSPMSGAVDTPANYNLVTFDLAPDGEKTKVTLSQDKLIGEPSAADLKQKDQFKKNWTLALDGLQKAVAH
jgi:uncharacterized protein YndB with AHSA1/START domain